MRGQECVANRYASTRERHLFLQRKKLWSKFRKERRNYVKFFLYIAVNSMLIVEEGGRERHLFLQRDKSLSIFFIAFNSAPMME